MSTAHKRLHTDDDQQDFFISVILLGHVARPRHCFNQKAIARRAVSFRSRSQPEYVVFGSQWLSGTFPDNHAGSHCLARYHTRHNRSVCDPKLLDSINL